MAEGTRTGSRERIDSAEAGAVKRLGVLVIAGLTALFFACAEVGPPPGGEVDDTGPSVVSTQPPNGAVEVAPSDKIIIEFSERVVEPITGRAFFISPRLREEPEIEWKGNRVTIEFPDSFATDQTYIISMSSQITDLRRNKFDSATTIAFSTGPTIAKGTMGGTVYRNGSPASGLLAGLFDITRATDSANWDSLYPTYVSQTNANGKFRFEYLPERQYRLVVYRDDNGNDRFDPAEEQFAVSDRPVVVGGDLPVDDLHLSLTESDTTKPEIVSVTYLGNNMIRARLSRPIGLGLIADAPGNMFLRSMTDTSRYRPALSILERDNEQSATITAVIGQPDTGLYRLTLDYDADNPPVIYDSVMISDREDKARPQIVNFSLEDRPYFIREADMRITFSEPLIVDSITDETFVLWEEPDSTLVPLSWEWEDLFHLDFIDTGLKRGRGYHLSVAEFDLEDPSGNVVGDSVRDYRFSILDDDSLGSVSGTVTIQLPGKERDPVFLTLRDARTGIAYDLRVNGRNFNADLPAGDYILSGFVDSDLDDKLSLGSVVPFEYAETQQVYPDTIEVRARFETAGIDFIFR